MSMWRHTGTPGLLADADRTVWRSPRLDEVMAFIPTLVLMRIQCAGRGCTTVAELQAHGVNQAEQQVELWVAGWRRDPDAALDYCPRCAPRCAA